MDHPQDQPVYAFHHRRMTFTRQGGNAGLLKDIPIFNIHNGGAQIGAAQITTNVFLHDSPAEKASPLPGLGVGVSG